MKKTFAFLLALALAFGCVACTDIKPGQKADPAVVDSETYTLSIFGEEAAYAIPEIVYEHEGTAELNRQIYDKLHGAYVNQVNYPMINQGMPAYGSMSYFWGYRNGYMSIVELCPIYASEGRDFFVFNIDTSTMQFTEAMNLLNACELTKEDFLAQSRKVMAASLYGLLQNELTGSDAVMKYEAEKLYADILSDENVAGTLPVLGENGALMIQCTLGSLYGMDRFTSFLPFDTPLEGAAKAFFESFDFENAGRVEISVVDRDCCERSYTEVGTAVFHMPQIICPAGQEDKMNKALWAAVDEQLGDSLSRTDVPQVVGWEYSWAVKGNAVSLLMWGNSPYSSWTYYLVKSFDVLSGEALSSAELAALYGLSEEGFLAQVRDRLGSEFLTRRGGSLGNEPYALLALDYTLDMNNVRQAVPYIGEGGELWFLGQLGQVAGAMYSWQCIPFNGEISQAYQELSQSILVVPGESLFRSYSNHSLGIKSASFDLPKIFCLSANQEASNRTLRQAVESFLGASLTDSVKGGPFCELNYGWGVKDRYVSVWLWAQYGPTDHDDYRTVTIDVSTGKELSAQEVAALYGISDMKAFKQNVTDRMGTLYLEQFAGFERDEVILYGLSLTCDPSHVDKASPVIGEDGKLYIAAPLGTVAGSGIDWRVFPYEGTVSEIYRDLYKEFIDV